MKGKDLPAVSAIKKVMNFTKKQFMKGKKIHVMAAVINKGGKCILKCTTLAA